MRPAVLGRKALLKVSRGAIEQLDPMALRWVVAHEVGHLTDSAGRRRVVMKGFFALLLSVVIAEAIAVTVSMLLAWPLIVGADRLAHRCCAADPDAARRALTAARRSSPLRWGPPFGATQALGGYPPFDERIAPST